MCDLGVSLGETSAVGSKKYPFFLFFIFEYPGLFCFTSLMGFAILLSPEGIDPWFSFALY